MSRCGAGQFTHVYVFGYGLGVTMDPAVVEVGFGREGRGLRSTYHGSPDLPTRYETRGRGTGVEPGYAPEEGSNTPRV